MARFLKQLFCFLFCFNLLLYIYRSQNTRCACFCIQLPKLMRGRECSGYALAVSSFAFQPFTSTIFFYTCFFPSLSNLYSSFDLLWDPTEHIPFSPGSSELLHNFTSALLWQIKDFFTSLPASEG